MESNGNFLFAGASSAIARATSQLLQSKGHRVIGLSTKSDIEGYSECHVVQDYRSASLPDLSEQFDGLVYFPGNINLKPFHRIGDDEFMHDYQLHVLGAVSLIKKYLPSLKSERHMAPGIVLISSVAAKVGMPFHSSVSMAKAALEGLTLALSAELAPKIRVNAVAPSLVQSPMGERFLNTPEKMEGMKKRNPMQLIGDPNDIAEMIAFLLLDARWITGQVLAVDGGMSSIKI